MAKSLIVNSQAVYDLIVQPQFSDIAAGFSGNYNTVLPEFTLVDNVSLSNGRNIIDITKNQNIMRRRDGSCKTNWSQVATLSGRKLKVEELYSATENCGQELYQGCMKDFRENNPYFQEQIMTSFMQATGTDIITNGFFGNVARVEDTTGTWSWNVIDGLFTKLAQYTNAGGANAPKLRTALASGVLTPSQCYGYLKDAYDNMTDVMRMQLTSDLAFYVDFDIAKGYERYLQSLGGNSTAAVGYVMNGIPTLMFEGIPVFVEPTWKPILAALNTGNSNAAAHALILTIRGNFLFGTNSKYGGGPNEDQGLRVWWSEDDEVWRRKMYLAGGVDLASPANTVYAVTTTSL